MDIIKTIENEYIKQETPTFSIGDTIKVSFKVKEGNRERVQVFEGTIIKSRGTGINKTLTVRKIAYGVGVERTFMLHSPRVDKIEVSRRGIVRRSKLYYLRDRIGKATKVKEKIEK
jgi:large subunit ribosomal protein L19